MSLCINCEQLPQEKDLVVGTFTLELFPHYCTVGRLHLFLQERSTNVNLAYYHCSKKVFHEQAVTISRKRHCG